MNTFLLLGSRPRWSEYDGFGEVSQHHLWTKSIPSASGAKPKVFWTYMHSTMHIAFPWYMQIRAGGGGVEEELQKKLLKQPVLSPAAILPLPFPHSSTGANQERRISLGYCLDWALEKHPSGSLGPVHPSLTFTWRNDSTEANCCRLRKQFHEAIAAISAGCDIWKPRQTSLPFIY